MKHLRISFILFLFLFLSLDSFSQQVFRSYPGSREYVVTDSLLYTSGRSAIQVMRMLPIGSTTTLGEPFFQLNPNTAVSEPLNGYVFYSGDNGFVAKVEVSDAVNEAGENLFDYQIIQFPFDTDLTDIELIGSRLVVSGANGFFAYSDDEGQSWNKVPTGITAHLTNIIDGFNKLYVTGHNGNLIISDDNGESWTQSATGTDRDIHDLHILSDGTGYAVGNNGIVLYTTNEGQSWSEIHNFGLYTDLRTIDFFNDDYGILAGDLIGDSGTAYMTNDGGETWTFFYQTPEIDVFNVDMIDPFVIVFAGPGGIYTEEIVLKNEINNVMVNLWQSLNHDSNLGILVGADWSTSSYGNFGMQFLGTEPRSSYPNTLTQSTNIRNITENPWNSSYSAIVNAKEVMENITSEWSKLEQNEIDLNVALSNFVQGLAYAQLALKFDQAEIYTEDLLDQAKANPAKRAGLGFTPSVVPQSVNQVLQIDDNAKDKELNQFPTLFGNNNIELAIKTSFAPYNDVLDVAKAKLKDGISAFNASGLTMPNDFINGFGGMTSTEFAEMINTLIAELEVMKARTASQNETEVDWDEVMTLTGNGVTTDYHPQGDDDAWVSYVLSYHNLDNWVRVDQKLIFMMDESQPNSYPTDGSILPEASSDDNRLTQDFMYHSSVPFPSGRGYYYFGNYSWNKFPNHSFGNAVGPMPFIYKASNNLLRAEAIIRTNGNKTEAANLINLTRNGNGGLPNLTGAETDQDMLDAIYYEWMIEVGPIGNGPIAWYNNRRFDKLQAGSLTQLPVPARVLSENGMSFYTFGGQAETNQDFYVYQPTDDTTTVSLEPTIKWHSDGNAATYNLRFNSGPNADSSILFEKTGLTEPSYTVTSADAELDYFKEYSVIVSALDANEDVYLTSSATSFKTIDTLAHAPTLINPSNNVVNTPNRVTFYWEVNIGNSKSLAISISEDDFHHLQLSTTSDFSSTVVDTLIAGFGGHWWTQTATIEDLNFDTKYFWRIATVNEAGESDWSQVFNFATMPVNNEGILQLITPANEATDVSLPAEFEWTSAQNAIGYELQASFDMDFTQSITISGIGDTTATTTPQILPDTSYYWRMRPVYTSGTGDWTVAQSFTTELPIPETPSWEPADGAIVDASVIEFTWGKSNFAQSYNVQVSDNSDFSNIIAQASELNQTSFEIDDLGSGTYYWRISATNASGTSDWSEHLMFEVSTSVSTESDANLPKSFTLKQNYPNPFNPTTNIEYGVPKAANVQLKVFNMLGQSVATLVSEKKSAGSYTVSFDASSLSSGIYIYVLKADNFIETRKLTLIK
ncbi:MAG: T9SS type A sorting domain-containing protein [Balneola sp.]